MSPNICFFGTPDIAVHSLDALAAAGLHPKLVVTNPDRPQGRSLTLTPPPVRQWADAAGIPVMQPTSLQDDVITALTKQSWDLFVVVAYGSILPTTVLSIPTHGVLNMHPSLLPAFRGPSPIRSAILADQRDTGVTIMLMDEAMDHGPIIAQRAADISPAVWPMRGQELDTLLATLGGTVLADTIPAWLAGSITPAEQDHARATYTKKLTKDMGELTIDPYHLPTGSEAYEVFLKICAFDGWPGTYFFHNNRRIKIVDAAYTNDGTLIISRIIPEGKQEVDFATYFQAQ